jgi:hypothetical protein
LRAPPDDKRPKPWSTGQLGLLLSTSSQDDVGCLGDDQRLHQGDVLADLEDGIGSGSNGSGQLGVCSDLASEEWGMLVSVSGDRNQTCLTGCAYSNSVARQTDSPQGAKVDPSITTPCAH